MTENKRYSEQNLENHLNRIYDNQECKVIFDEDIVDLLNEQDKRIQELKKALDNFKPIIFKNDGEDLILYSNGDSE